MNCPTDRGYYHAPRISSEYSDCALPLTGDTYNICGFQCQYCFGFYAKSNNPGNKGGFFQKPINVKAFKELFGGKKPDNPYYKHFIKYRFPMHFGSLTDMFDTFEEKYGIGLEIIDFLGQINYPTLISTKGTLAMKNKYYELFKKYAHNHNFGFQFSITCNSDELAKQMEPVVPSVTERLECMKKMSELGYWTILRLRPYIIGYSNIDIEKLIERASNAGAKAISCEFFCLDVRTNEGMEKRYKKMSEIVGFDIKKYYSTLSPSERGGYQRLNRNVKEKYVKELYLLCKKHGLQFNISDPDFKELNESGCCCGLPEKPYMNSELHKWARAQLTYLLKELRKRYWKSNGKDKLLKWKDVLDLQFSEWFWEHKYYGDSIKYWITNYKIKDKVGFGDEFHQCWNKLRSSANPYNYFHGVLKPHHADENGDIVYEYNPKEYELRWMKEGVL